MADANPDPEKAGKPATAEYTPPAGAKTAQIWSAGGQSLGYLASADWTVLRKKEKPAAEIFSVSYVVDSRDERPVTFVFNGGPGSASAYLHMGAVGPVRVDFPPDGSLPRMPPKLVPNEESWLSFTDLVFIDPVGTGFSRVIDESGASDKKSGDGATGGGGEQEYYGYTRDLESICEFISRWLSGHDRWGSPIFIAGESYGGYRVGRLVRLLQEDAGIGLNGAVLISPALEIGQLNANDYDVAGWVDRVPTMALAAAHHGRSRAFGEGASLADVAREAEEFASGDYATLLIRGAAVDAEERSRILGRLADLIGVSSEFVARAEGRVDPGRFARELLRETRRVIGLYDATVTAVDPFPDRPERAGPDPTLGGIGAAFTGAINRHLRSEIGVKTDREYVLLSYEVNGAWRDDDGVDFFVPPKGATDDFRYGLALNPHMKAFITHGLYDLVTPYYGTDRLENLMRLDPDTARRITVRHFPGGHMFYAWEASRRAFSAAIAEFVAAAL